ncbi:MAG: putative esterase lipoprotein [Solirubrobacterales bacterium]|nr:putative esterase lipoprotein [Solirubrobacterales bacterium]
MRRRHSSKRGVVAASLLLLAVLGAVLSSGHGPATTTAATAAPPAATAAPALAAAPIVAAAARPAGCTTTARSGDRTLRLRVGAETRTARLHVPRAALGHAAPVVLAFHGAGGSGRFMEGYSGLPGAVDRSGVISVYPDAVGGRWNLDEDVDGTHGHDLAFTQALLDTVRRRHCVDPRRISAVGVSNGGGFAARLACAMAGRLAGVVVVAGGFSLLPECRPARPVSVLEIHGTADPVVPYAGRPRDNRAGAVRPWLDGWARVNGCARVPSERQVAQRVRRLEWRRCQASSAVAHLRISGGMHQWPGANPPDAGPAATISAAQEAWAFLASRRSPA